MINQHLASNSNSFRFSHVSPNEVMKQIVLLDRNKSSSGNIPTGMLKAAREIVCPYLKDCINSAIYDCKFPNELKEADLNPLFKNDDPNYKGNFRPISVLPAASKVYERILKRPNVPILSRETLRILVWFQRGV